MTLILAWLRIELRQRWRSLLVLALLIAIASGTVLAAVAGARRGASSTDRLLAQTLPADALVQPFQPHFDWDAVRALPEVAAVSTSTRFNGSNFGNFTVDELAGVAPDWGVATDAEAMQAVERPVVLAGRLADPRRADEAVVAAQFLDSHQLAVGGTVTMRLFTPTQIDDAITGAGPPTSDIAPAGPAVPVRIVGVIRSPFSTDDAGGLFPSLGVLTRYRANLLGALEGVPLSGLVRLRGGEADLDAFRADLARVSGRHDIEVVNRADAIRHLQEVTRFEAGVLLAFAIAGLLAAVVLIGQAIARHSAGTAANVLMLRALGLTRAQGVLIAAVGPVLAALAGAAVGVAAAVVGSRWMPFGAASTVEPAPGVDADVLVLGVGAAATLLLVFGAAAVAAGVAAATTAPTRPNRGSTLARASSRLGLPLPVVLGTRFALEPAAGWTRAALVRPALVSAVVGVLGVLAALTFSAGVADAAAHPERFGVTHNVVVGFGYNGEDFVPPTPVLETIAADPDVAGVTDAPFAVADAGRTTLDTFSFDPVGTPVPIALTAGSAPTAPHEIVLAPTAARLLAADVGSIITLTGDTGTGPKRVVGIGFVPEVFSSHYDRGAWVTTAGFRSLFGSFRNHVGLVAFRPGTDPGTVLPRLKQAVQGRLAGGPLPVYLPSTVPRQLHEIQDVRALPLVLGGFLGLLAVGAVGHALVTVVLRRRRDVAVLRALGMTRRQAREIVITQATVLAGIGLLFGIPLGLALGRTLWRAVADSTPLQYVPPVAFWALVLVVPVAMLLANLLAAVPGRRAARMRVSQILRAE